MNLNKCSSMETKINVVSLKLNKTDKQPKNYICIENENGILLVDDGLFSISFNSRDDMIEQDVEIIEENKSNLIVFL